MQQNIAFYFFILATSLTEKHCFWQLKTSKTLIFEFLISLFGKFSPVKKNLLGVEIFPILKDKKYSSKTAFLVCCHIESQSWLVRVLGSY
jgi:hypothetical protein